MNIAAIFQKHPQVIVAHPGEAESWEELKDLTLLIGDNGFFWALLVVHAAVGLFALYRMSRRAATPLDEQSPALYIARSTSAVAAASALTTARDQMEQDE